MKTLYIIRHAKSSWKYHHLDDIDRPLNKRGKRDAPDMGERLSVLNIIPHLMISSPAKRAYATCKTIAKALEYPKEAIEINDKLYHASEDSLMDIIQDIENSWDSVMIFGHNPGLTLFANSLADTNIDNIPTCGIVACTFDVDSWAETDFGKGKLMFYDYPKKVSKSEVN
ncbi:histidine phosphatase family protein [Fulvivirga maritima]|uniref:SixA phosphatase family protein n=1 Tax=Fulvivirga maritima TaxID=2904247 RepID=UPI001F217CFA|nr:histidine phosphatase family protein [Fulvivirga maritima]UII29010.1 histidine phosphatase family protein [Fulvivirga maritima]